MTGAARRDAIHIAFLVLIALFFVPKLFYANTSLYTRFLTETPLTYIASLTKLLFLLMGFVFARRCAARFEKGNPVRPAWQLLGWGLIVYFLGQSVLGLYQLILLTDAPFPSPGDLFFLLAMALWFVSLAWFIRAYTLVGFLEGGIKQTVTTGILATILIGIPGYVLLIPILETPAPFLEKALNIAYPLSDLILMIPVLLLVRMAYRLRGGEVRRVWLALLFGFFCLGVGDIMFAYFSTMGKDFLDPLLDVMFAYSYIFISWGTAYQYELLRS